MRRRRGKFHWIEGHQRAPLISRVLASDWVSSMKICSGCVDAERAISDKWSVISDQWLVISDKSSWQSYYLSWLSCPKFKSDFSSFGWFGATFEAKFLQLRWVCQSVCNSAGQAKLFSCRLKCRRSTRCCDCVAIVEVATTKQQAQFITRISESARRKNSTLIKRRDTARHGTTRLAW